MPTIVSSSALGQDRSRARERGEPDLGLLVAVLAWAAAMILIAGLAGDCHESWWDIVAFAS